MAEPFDEFVQHSIIDNGFIILPIETRHAAELAVLTLSFGHRDPFDRLLVAQAKTEDIPILSADAQLELYGIKRWW